MSIPHTNSSGQRHTPSLTRDWLALVLIMPVSGAFVIAGVLMFFLSGDRYSQKMTVDRPGMELSPYGTHARHPENDLLLGPLPHGQRLALEVSTHEFWATDYQGILIELGHLNDRILAALVWPDSTAPGGYRSAPIAPLTSERNWIDLSELPGWRGRIGRLYLIVHGPVSETASLTRVQLQPHPPTVGGVLTQLWRDWTMFEGWRAHSINFIVGGPRNALAHPVPVVVAWIALTTAFYTLWVVIRRQRFHLAPFVVIIFLGWILLDLRWQADLSRQIVVTHALYAGKNQHEKRLAAPDAALYRFAERVKEQLPRDSTRLFLVVPTSMENHYYMRTRLHYLLLPTNVGSLWDLPPTPDQTIGGEFILVLRPHPGVQYDRDHEILSWGEHSELRATRIMAHPTGDLFRVR